MPRILPGILVGFLLASSAQAASFIQYASQRGQYFWGGTQATITTPASTFSASRHGSGVQITTQGANNWTVTLDPPSGQQLALGTYSSANENLLDATHGQVALSGDGRDCSPVDWGNFTILDLAFDASQNVTQFAADLEVHCDGYEPAVFAGIRFNSNVAYTAPSTAFAGPAFIQWMSQAGDQIGASPGGTYTRDDGVFNTRIENGGTAGVHLWAYPDGNLLNHFDVEFAPASGQRLAPGTYENAREMPAHDGHPGIDVRGARGCGLYGQGGRFVVYEVEYDPAGHVSKLAADFEEHCAGSSGGIFGAVRFNSTVAYAPPASVDLLPASLKALDNTSYAVARNTSVPGPRMQVLDGGQRPMPGIRVRFDSPACGSLNGTSFAEVISDANGVAQMPTFLAGNYSRTDCEVSASIPGTGVWPYPIDLWIFVPSELTLSALPTSTIVVNSGQAFRVGVQAVDSGYPVSFSTATFTVMPGTGGATVASLTSATLSDANGQAFADGVAGAGEGTYSIVASIGGATQTINVTQHASSAPPTPQVGDVQNMWWVGPAENGWGMSLIQHSDDTLFAALYIYDSSGNPTWVVMPGGSWDATHTVYSGSLYEPTGSPFYAYDTTHFVAGNAIGTIKLTFTDSDNATLDYTMGSSTGHKSITREIFGGDTIVGTDQTDLWWGGTSQNGWGMTIMQQGSTLFPIWYTYDPSGKPIWYVMPGGTWTSPLTYSGTLYRTTGSPWIGTTYDPSKLQAFNVGTFGITFNGEAATFNYTADGHSGSIPLVREPF